MTFSKYLNEPVCFMDTVAIYLMQSLLFCCFNKCLSSFHHYNVNSVTVHPLISNWFALEAA